VKYLDFDKRMSAWMVITAFVFSLIAPPIITAHECDCVIEGNAEVVYTAAASLDDDIMTACCCANSCAPMPVSEILFTDMVDRGCMDIHPICCCASESLPPPAVTSSFIKDDRRPSYTDFEFLSVLPSAFMPRVHNILFCSTLAFERDLKRVPPHIPSTILLI
jgi:hypothetical protein